MEKGLTVETVETVETAVNILTTFSFFVKIISAWIR